VYRASGRDLHQALALGSAEISLESDLALNVIDEPELRLTVSTVERVDSMMPESDLDATELPILAPRVEEQRDRGAASQCRKQEIVRRGTFVGSTILPRLVGHEGML
jgi:hypothetical protein